MSQLPPSICIASLGGQPQVVTLALDALLARGEQIGELIVIHLSERNERYRSALAALAREFAGDRYAGRPCRYRPLAITLGGALIEDLNSEPAAGAALNTLVQLIQRLKRQERAIHLCVSGGRRLLGMLAMSAIQIHGDHTDHVWHLYSSDAVRERTAGGAELHLPANPEVRLVRVPVMPFGQHIPWLRTLEGAQPAPADEQARCREVVGLLTPSQHDVLRAFARGCNPQQAATELNVSISTIHAHKTRIFELCHDAWELTDADKLSYHWLRDHFRGYFIS